MSKVKSIFTEKRLTDLKYHNYNIYVVIMHKLGMEPEPEKDMPTMDIIIETRKLLTKDEKDKLNFAKACMLIAYRPAVELLRKVVYKYPEINYIRTKKIIQKIEKRLYKMKLFRKSSAVVGLAIHLGNNISPKKSSIIIHEFISCSHVTIRNLGKLIKIGKKR